MIKSINGRKGLISGLIVASLATASCGNIPHDKYGGQRIEGVGAGGVGT